MQLKYFFFLKGDKDAECSETKNMYLEQKKTHRLFCDLRILCYFRNFTEEEKKR